jgi:hypothetical protein
MDLENFVRASELKIKIFNIINNKNLPENFYNVNNNLVYELRKLIVELLIHPELFQFFGKNIHGVLNKNKNNFSLTSINEIIQVLWKTN